MNQEKHNGTTQAQNSVASSALFGVMPQVESGNAICEAQASGTSENQPIDVDVSLSLPQVFGLFECPEAAERHLGNLAKTHRERSQWEALLHLWQSLGRPGGFWCEIRVFYNRIASSYKIMPNVRGERRG